jgi:signal transduction histidine kinase
LTLPANDAEVASGSFGGLLNRSLYVSQPLGEDRALLIVAPRPTALAALAEETILPIVLRAGLVALVASVVLAWLVSRWVAAPLRRTAEAARAVAAGDLNQQLAPSGPEEAHSLAVSFNEMVQQVRGSQQAMRDFVANVSHELKTPLTSIQGFAQAIVDGTAADPQHAGDVIHDEAARLARLVEELLDLAKLDTGQAGLDRRPVDLPAILAAIVERLGLKAQQRGVVLENRANSLPGLIGDGDRLAQVFTNLIDNALKHTPRGGVVKLGTQLDPGWITVHVEDSGPGIPPNELSRIFERFYQLDKARSGSGPRGVGLGLAISREIVQSHGGTVSATSTMGQGSRFSVRLPISRPGDVTLARPRV